MRLLSGVKLLLPVLLLATIGLVSRLWPVTVSGARVEAGPVVDEVLGIGGLESDRAVQVAFEVSGRVTALLADEGDTVPLGGPLGVVDVDDARGELRVSEATVAAAGGDVSRARAELERGRITAVQAAKDRARSEILFAAGDLSGSAHEAAVERDDGAHRAVQALEAALSRAIAAREAAIGGRQLREAKVTDGALTSPLAGLVVSRSVEVGQWVGAGAPAFTVIAADALEVRAWVDETALGRLKIGQPVRLVFRSEPDRSYPGRLARIGREVDRQTHELLVDVAVEEAPTNFALGQRADAWIEAARRDDALRVPRGWCEQTCLVVEGARAVRRPVTLGLVGREHVEVVAGLSAGDVVLPPGAVTDGRFVRVEEGR